MARARLYFLDTMRGTAVLAMLVYHLLYNLYFYGNLPRDVMFHPLMRAFQISIGVTFLFVAGISARLSRSNIRRGARLFLIAMGITAVSYLIGNPILFGVLHLLSISMILYGITGRWVEKIPPGLLLFLCAAGIFFGQRIIGIYPSAPAWAFPLGFRTATFYSADYYPLLPWVFVFLSGVAAGSWVITDRIPRWLRAQKQGYIAMIGQRALLIYIVHQPILLGAQLAIQWIIR